MIKVSYLIFLFLTLWVSAAFGQSEDFTQTLRNKVSLYYSNNIPVNLQLFFNQPANSYRMPDYHRLNLSLILEGSHRRKKFWDGAWIISFYNIYARKNAYSVFYRDNSNSLLQPYKLSVIGTAIPSVSYSFKL